MLPLLIRPKYLSIKNRYAGNFRLSRTLGRDLTLALFSALIIWALYYAISTALVHLKANQSIAQIHPSTILGLIFMTIFCLLVFSNIVTALGALFLSHDLGLVLASPIKHQSFFLGKLLEIFASSTWMVLTFGVPVIVAFADFYNSEISFYLLTAVVMLPLLFIPSALAIGIVTIFGRLIPANRSRELLVALGAIAIFILMIFLRNLFNAPKTPSINDIVHVLSLIKATNLTFLPSYWSAVILGEALESSGKNLSFYISMLYCTAIFFLAASYLIYRKWHYQAFSAPSSLRTSFKIDSRTRNMRYRFLRLLLPVQDLALITKEYKVFLRDMTQAMQLGLLLGLCMLYIYNFRALRIIETFPETLRLWWQGMMLVGNISLGSFVVAAVSTRFVFSSVSYEGKAYWILSSAPLKIGDLLRAKFRAWYLPVALIATVLLCSGALAMNVELHGVITCAILAWIICYGIVGLGIGLGAVYANFDWEHASQLAASFGSLIYMVTSAVLIGLQVLPSALIIFLKSAHDFGHKIPEANWYFTTISCFVFVAYINYSCAQWALRIGEQSLERMKA